MDILNLLKKKYKEGSIIFKLIFINAGVFIIVNIFELFLFLFSPGGQIHFSLIDYLAVPADLETLLYRPWTVITYMFLHYDFLHILFNMLWLYWFGQIFLEYLDPKRMLSVYLIGGISGAALYIATFNLLPAFQGSVAGSVALGASASVYAIVIAISAFVPDYSIGLLFIGRVKLKYIALFVVGLDILSIAKGNAGGHIAHLGGAMFGYLFAIRLKKGKDITKGFSATMDYLFSLFKPGPKMKVSSNKYKSTQKPGTGPANSKTASDLDYNKKKAVEQAEIDRILDKISKYGYENLTKEEKNILFDQRKK
jgi:membrane associated rhomboid family serine protease